MSKHNHPLKVGVTVFIEMETLTKIQDNITGKSQSEKLRKCLEEGYSHLQKKEDEGLTPKPDQPPMTG